MLGILSAMKIEPMLLSINPFSRPGEKLKKVSGIVIHWVENAGTSAVANRAHFQRLRMQREAEHARYGSAHFIIGLSGEIIQCIPLDEMAYHVGASSYCAGIQKRLSRYPNNCTIGIELCHPSWVGTFNQATYDSAVQLTAHLLKQCALSSDALYRHYDITGKCCPKYFVENPAAWAAFKAAVDTVLTGSAAGVLQRP